MLGTYPAKPLQRGVVLIAALIVLMVVSMLATFSIRNSASTESASGAVRTNNLAAQAAEIGLRFCEDVVTMAYGQTPTLPPSLTTTPTVFVNPSSPMWQSLTFWDAHDALTKGVFAVPGTIVNQSALGSTYQRAPECIIEAVPVQLSTGQAANNSTSFLITARGFGPEVVGVATGANRRPQGSEVWLQSTFELGVSITGGGGGGGGNDGDGGDMIR
ncbi:pilus assembly PilX family protein [Candidatus Symbiobacter mobilis]|uniref:PilX/PilW C-terminal domain-containing protein n=1 Tax=Candidatus Symbiobacter mobilis CR TaxID=946483 RepID=U5N715_9BURK|nr:hypothetical protein [Candidatus Symbiobacter mobilis]AGX87177.1 hypothetical protein Cenrod_1083 [Candidatus Symbiobacter mobilis CR]